MHLVVQVTQGVLLEKGSLAFQEADDDALSALATNLQMKYSPPKRNSFAGLSPKDSYLHAKRLEMVVFKKKQAESEKTPTSAGHFAHTFPVTDVESRSNCQSQIAITSWLWVKFEGKE